MHRNKTAETPNGPSLNGHEILIQTMPHYQWWQVDEKKAARHYFSAVIFWR